MFKTTASSITIATLGFICIISSISLLQSLILHNLVSSLISILFAGIEIGLFISIVIVSYISDRDFKKFWEPLIAHMEEYNNCYKEEEKSSND